jgi:hypothetical protein
MQTPSPTPGQTHASPGHELDELLAGRQLEEHAADRAGDQPGLVGADAAGRHAHVQALAVDRGALAVELFVQDHRQLVGQVLLQPRAPRDHLHEPRHLRQAEHLAGRDVRHRDPVDHREQVVRAHPERGVVLGDDHLAVLGGEGLGQERLDLGGDRRVAVDQLVEALGGAGRGPGEVLVVDVVAEDAEAFDDLVEALVEQRQRLGVELHKPAI